MLQSSQYIRRAFSFWVRSLKRAAGRLGISNVWPGETGYLSAATRNESSSAMMRAWSTRPKPGTDRGEAADVLVRLGVLLLLLLPSLRDFWGCGRSNPGLRGWAIFV